LGIADSEADVPKQAQAAPITFGNRKNTVRHALTRRIVQNILKLFDAWPGVRPG
jgi:hypothetical protein